MGGDWYDTFVLANGSCGSWSATSPATEVEAAVVMGRLRSTLRAYALDDHSPEEVLARADRKLQIFEPAETATVLCGLLGASL